MSSLARKSKDGGGGDDERISFALCLSLSLFIHLSSGLARSFLGALCPYQTNYFFFFLRFFAIVFPPASSSSSSPVSFRDVTRSCIV